MSFDITRQGFEALIESRGLSSDSTCVLEAESCKLDIKRRELGILFIRLPICSLLKIAIIMLLLLSSSFQRHRRHSKSIMPCRRDKGTCIEIDNIYQANG